MPGHDDDRDHPSETVQAMVERATASIRVDIDNLERIYEPLKEKGNDNSYEIRRLKEITDDLKKNEAVLRDSVQKLTNSTSDLPLIRRIVYIIAGLLAMASLTLIFNHAGLPIKPL